MLYDDGYEEFVCPSKPDTKYQWLTPRARTAGATDAVHAAFKLLQAANAGECHETKSAVLEEFIAEHCSCPLQGRSLRRLMNLGPAGAVPSADSSTQEAAPHVPMVVTPPPVAASAASVSHTADGSHLDALVPLRPSSGMGGAFFPLVHNPALVSALGQN